MSQVFPEDTPLPEIVRRAAAIVTARIVKKDGPEIAVEKVIKGDASLAGQTLTLQPAGTKQGQEFAKAMAETGMMFSYAEPRLEGKPPAPKKGARLIFFLRPSIPEGRWELAAFDSWIDEARAGELPA